MKKDQKPKENPIQGKPLVEKEEGGSKAYVILISSIVTLLIAMILTSDMLFSKQRDEETQNSNGDSIHAPPAPHFTSNVQTTDSTDSVEETSHLQKVSEASCYTLEEYSLKFIAPHKNRKGDNNNNRMQYFFRCGTRLIDLNTERNQSKVELCMKKEKQQPKTTTMSTLTSNSMFSSLRVYLEDAYEVQLHLEQQYNVAAQRIPLERLNDDYCDCLDGTDELQTSACSMSGAVSPLSHERWKRYLIANAHVRLYHEEEPPSEQRTARLLRRLGGPVLPFACRGDSNVWLAPSRVGDGVVDCCDGSDEEKKEKEKKEEEEEKEEEVKKQWKLHVLALQPYLHTDSGMMSMLSPTIGGKRTVAGMLLDKDLTSLMSCRRVKEERLRDARGLAAMVKEGNIIYKQRKAEGWERYGKQIVQDRDEMKKKVQTISEEFDQERKRIIHLMEMAQTRDPFAAGVTNDELMALDNLYRKLEQEALELRHIQLMLTFRWLGNDFEYYPLAQGEYEIPLERVVYTAESNAVSIQEERERHLYNTTFLLDTPPEYVDNTTYEHFAFRPYLYIMGTIQLTSEHRRLLKERDELLNVNKSSNTSQPDYNNIRGPPVIFGYWIPDKTEISLQKFTAMDNAGGVLLRRRLFMYEEHPIMGGMEQSLLHERYHYTGNKRRVLRVPSKDNKNPSTREQVERAAGVSKDMVEVEIPHQYNTPDMAAVQLFLGGASCGLRNEKEKEKNGNTHDDKVSDTNNSNNNENNENNNNNNNEESEKTMNTLLSGGRVVYVCAPADSILEWYRNGNCQHEVLFGSPSACSQWTLERAKERLQQAEEALRQEEEKEKEGVNQQKKEAVNTQ
ncbi:uncharacterized protein TM35_000311800 [Trypanosoma theileri]|uniref:Glucosidase II beta subunit-like protein n=1 Tax=Trypanosoma theileri TaxID=67003 RepID=A0A1X0NMP0_9TRYP|nr:uncharacterized protein TM35_000311800 [Trypanosoma theileri]ORC85994.1 hypothetical protein TM35_000311800 [Trypanosoma theileri]